jgi:hypothetical protein
MGAVWFTDAWFQTLSLWRQARIGFIDYNDIPAGRHRGGAILGQSDGGGGTPYTWGILGALHYYLKD